MSVRYSSSFGRRFVFVRCKYCCEVQGWTHWEDEVNLRAYKRSCLTYLAPDFSLIFLKYDFGSTQLFFGFWLAHVDPCFPICCSAFSRCFQLIFSLGAHEKQTAAVHRQGLWKCLGLPSWLRQWRLSLQVDRTLQVRPPGKIPWRRAWLPTPVFLPGKSHRQRSLVAYSPRRWKESDATERLTFALESAS